MRTHGATGLRLRLLGAVALCCLAAACGGAKSRFESHLKRGQGYLQEGNLEKAGVEFRNAAQIQPKSAPALYFLGRVAEARGNIREAFGYYQASIEADARYAPARAGAGKMLVFAGAAQRAADVVAPALATEPDDPDLLAVRAAALQRLNQLDAAFADARRAVSVAPANANAVAMLAALYVQRKEQAQAILAVNAGLAKDPGSIELREVLVNLYLMNGDAARAQEQMRRIIELRPMELQPRAQLARSLIRNHDLDGAQAVLEQAVAALSNSKQQSRADEARLLLVDFISGERSRAQGEKTLRQFISQEPRNLDLRLGLGALLQRSGAQSEAIAAYQEVIKLNGTEAKGLAARDRIAAIALSQGREEDARRLIREVLQKNPRDDDALILRSTLAMRQNDPTGAIADLRAVLRSRPDSVPLQRSLAAAYLAKGQTALAEEALRAAMTAASNDVTVRIELAQLLARTDRLPQSIALLEETVKLLPDSPEAREALIKTYLASKNLRAAQEQATELQARQPQSAAGFYFAGIAATLQKRYADGIAAFEQALKLDPRRFDVLAALVQVELARGRYDGAVERLKAALAQNPDNLEIIQLLGGTYFDHHDLDGASAMFTRAAQLNPRMWQPHRNLAKVSLARMDTASALTEYQTALALAPAEPRLVAEAASVLEKQGRIDDAISRYDALYKADRRWQEFAANNLAMLLVTYKTDQPSLDRARDLTDRFTLSTDGKLLDTAGWVRFKRGEYEAALPALERALERSPDSRVIRFHLGMAQMQLGQRDRARSSLEAALSGAQDFEGADEARSALARLKGRA